MALANETIRYFVGRRNLATDEEQVIHENNYTNLNVAYDNFEQSNGYKEVTTANREAARLNASEADKAKDVGRAIKWHYFTFRKDDKVTTLANYTPPEPTPTEETKQEEPTE